MTRLNTFIGLNNGGIMCVSAEASFSLAGVLMPVGIYCLKKAAQRDCSSLPIAAIPLLFGIQQLCEGLVWVGVGRDDAKLTQAAALVFLFFALAFWLFWIPFSALFLEPRNRIRLALGLTALLGAIGGAVLFIPVVLHPDVLRTSVVHHSIQYTYADPPTLLNAPQIVWHVFYVIIVSIPLILSKNKMLLGYSTALVVSAVISHVYFWYAFASIWCLFAATLSICLAYLFHNWPQRKTNKLACR